MGWPAFHTHVSNDVALYRLMYLSIPANYQVNNRYINHWHIYPSIIYLAIYLSSDLSIYLSVCLSVCLQIDLSTETTFWQRSWESTSLSWFWILRVYNYWHTYDTFICIYLYNQNSIQKSRSHAQVVPRRGDTSRLIGVALLPGPVPEACATSPVRQSIWGQTGPPLCRKATEVSVVDVSEKLGSTSLPVRMHRFFCLIRPRTLQSSAGYRSCPSAMLGQACNVVMCVIAQLQTSTACFAPDLLVLHVTGNAGSRDLTRQKFSRGKCHESMLA